MNKKQFIEAMTTLMSIKKDEEALSKAFKKFEPDFNYISFGRYETLVIDTLEIAMNDTGEWISYFLYERRGEFTKKKIISDKNGKNLPLRNFDDLYNLIVRK